MTSGEFVILLAALGTFLIAAAGAFVSVWNAVHLSQVHSMVNGQSEKLLSLTREAGFDRGVAAVSAPDLAHTPPVVEPLPSERAGKLPPSDLG